MSTRVEREREFHDRRFATGPRRAARKYYETDAGKQVYRSKVIERIAPGVRLLEYGCGAGSLSVATAGAGADVVGIDISEVALTKARKRARKAKVSVEYLEMNAQDLDFPDESFDLVCGSGILHHLELEPALAEVERVLRPGGTALFVEPLGHNPLINLYRRLTPAMRSVDEVPLRLPDLEAALRPFYEVTVEHFDLFALAGVPLRRTRWGEALLAWLHTVDRWLFRRSKLARRLAWVVVIEARRPPAG